MVKKKKQKEKDMRMTQHIPVSMDVARHTFISHLKSHLPSNSDFTDAQLGQLNMWIEEPCDCGRTKIIVCALCLEGVFVRTGQHGLCDCVRGIV